MNKKRVIEGTAYHYGVHPISIILETEYVDDRNVPLAVNVTDLFQSTSTPEHGQKIRITVEAI